MKILIKIICLIIVTAAVTLSAFSCAGTQKMTKYTDYSFEYFDTATQIIGYAGSKEEFDDVCGKIKSLLAEYHRLYDIYFSYDGINNIRTINLKTNGAHSIVKVDRKIIDLLEYSKEIYEITDGYTNIAMGAVLSIWHTYRENGINSPESARLPSTEELKTASEHTNIDNIIIDKENNTVFLSDPEMSLDVGAIAKGYAVERVAEFLYQSGITDYLLNVGGNIKAVGTHYSGEAWQIGIENPNIESDEKYIEYMKAEDISIVTSGSYRRYYTVDGIRYNHIIDPETLMPVTRFDSVTVITGDSGLGDALSTALFCMSLDDGLLLINPMPDTEAMWVEADGDKFYSDNCSDYTFEYDS